MKHTDPIVRRRTGLRIPLRDRPRWLWPAVAAVITLIVVGAVIVGLSLSNSDTTADGAVR